MISLTEITNPTCPCDGCNNGLDGKHRCANCKRNPLATRKKLWDRFKENKKKV